MPIKNFYSANSAEPGDIFVLVLKATVQYNGTYRLYRCRWPDPEIGEDDSPQGDRAFSSTWFDMVDGEENSDPMNGIQVAAETLFPILRATKGPDLTG
jgi:hypothetical protein